MVLSWWFVVVNAGLWCFHGALSWSIVVCGVFIVICGDLWGFVVVCGDLWEFVVVRLWFMVIHGGSWWFMVVGGGSWWFMVVDN